MKKFKRSSIIGKAYRRPMSKLFSLYKILKIHWIIIYNSLPFSVRFLLLSYLFCFHSSTPVIFKQKAIYLNSKILRSCQCKNWKSPLNNEVADTDVTCDHWCLSSDYFLTWKKATCREEPFDPLICEVTKMNLNWWNVKMKLIATFLKQAAEDSLAVISEVENLKIHIYIETGQLEYHKRAFNTSHPARPICHLVVMPQRNEQTHVIQRTNLIPVASNLNNFYLYFRHPRGESYWSRPTAYATSRWCNYLVPVRFHEPEYTKENFRDPKRTKGRSSPKRYGPKSIGSEIYGSWDNRQSLYNSFSFLGRCSQKRRHVSR